MKIPGKNEVWQAMSFLLCIVVAWVCLDDFGASEFRGGRITGPVFSMFDDAWLIFFFAILLTFVYPRVAAALAIAATLLCLPLYLYVIAPGPFRFIFPGNWKSPLEANLAWNTWAIAGLLTLAAAVFISVRSFSGAHHREMPVRTDNV
jgi:hypothetical protein